MLKAWSLLSWGGCSDGGGHGASLGRGDGSRLGRLRRVVLVDGDVEAGLLELFLDVDEAGELLGEKPVAHPGNFAAGHAVFGDVDGAAGQVGADDVAFGGGGIAVAMHEVGLVFDSADGGADEEGVAELLGVGVGEVGEEGRGPGPAVLVGVGQLLVDVERGRDRHRDEEALGDATGEVVFVEDAFEAVGFGALVLAGQGLKGAAQGRRHAEAAGEGDGGGDESAIIVDQAPGATGVTAAARDATGGDGPLAGDAGATLAARGAGGGLGGGAGLPFRRGGGRRPRCRFTPGVRSRGVRCSGFVRPGVGPD